MVTGWFPLNHYSKHREGELPVCFGEAILVQQWGIYSTRTTSHHQHLELYRNPIHGQVADSRGQEAGTLNPAAQNPLGY